MAKSRAASFTLLLVVLTVLGACSKSDGGAPTATTTTLAGPLDKAGYVAKVNGICASGKAKMAAVPKATFPVLDDPQFEQKMTALREYGQKMAAIAKTTHDEILEVQPPASDPAVGAQLAARFEDGIAKLPDGIILGDEFADQGLYDYGLMECMTVPKVTVSVQGPID